MSIREDMSVYACTVAEQRAKVSVYLLLREVLQSVSCKIFESVSNADFTDQSPKCCMRSLCMFNL